MPKPRVNIPTNPGELLILAAAIFAKHQALGANSPLKNLAETAVAGPTIAPTTDHQNEAENLKRQMEEEYRERDKFLGAIQEWVRLSRDLLLPLNAKNVKALGQWGFTVDDTPKVKPATAAEAKKGGNAAQG